PVLDITSPPLCGAVHLFPSFPAHWNGDADAWTGPCGPGADGGGAEAIAQVVDEYLPYTISRAAFRCEAPRKGRGHVQHNGMGEVLDRIPAMAPLQWHHHMQALAAACFHKGVQFQLLQEGL